MHPNTGGVPKVGEMPETSQTPVCRLTGSLWGHYDVYFDRPVAARVYLGKQVASQELVWFKEYPLTGLGDALRRQAFKQLIDLNLQLGNGPDFRLVKLKDFVVTEQACYLITAPFAEAQPLSQYLATRGPLSPQQVKQFLQQSLESLRYLHTACRAVWPAPSPISSSPASFPTLPHARANGQPARTERGLCHGNLSLDTVWIRHPDPGRASDFLIYMTDLALWEHLFWPGRAIATHSQDLGSIAQDLEAVGRLSISLLVGRPAPSGIGFHESSFLAPLSAAGSELAAFITRLIGGPEPFRSTEDALQVLRTLPEQPRQPLSWPEPEVSPASPPCSPAPSLPLSPSKKHQLPLTKRSLGIAFSILGGIGLTFGYRQFRQSVSPSASESGPSVCCFDKINVAQQTKMTYFLEPYGLQSYSLQSPGGRGLQTLQARLDSVDFVPAQPAAGRLDQMTREDIFEQLLAGQADFALMLKGSDIPDGLAAQGVAYDALVPFVAFSEDRLDHNAAPLLGGSLTLAQLRQIFTGELKTINGIPIEPYFPVNPDIKAYPDVDGSNNKRPPKVRFPAQTSALALFQETLLEGDAAQIQTMSAVLDSFKATLKQRIQAEYDHTQSNLSQSNPGQYDIVSNVTRAIYPSNTGSDALPPSIGIGFDRLSQLRHHCNIYPLAVEVNNQPVQLLQHSQGRPIDTASALCRDRTQIRPDVDLIKQLAADYPLVYEIVVVYPPESDAGSTVTQLLQTAEGQALLNEVGLVPQWLVEP